MLKFRSIPVSIILTIITCGIYGIYWVVCLGDEVKFISKDESAPSGGMLILLTIVTCGIYFYYWCYKAGYMINSAKQANGMYCDNNLSIIYVLLSIFRLSIVTYALIQSELNKFASPQK